MYKKIVVAVDGSPVSFRALNCGIELAKKFNSIIELVAIVNTNNIPVSVGVTNIPLINDLEEQVKKHVKVAEQQLKNSDIEYNVIVEKGDPRGLIATEVPKHTGADLIIMGKTGKHAIRNLLIGSVTHRVIEKAKVAVLLVD
ncbi:universal stress protein [Companilactobacillus insicii]|uniref:universal stress protein n=1 Tax=Companilactobacillus insicii TaxID=1732567 RepID=UPI000F7BA8E4|nr:universal stress protein [Companilactobacillus insicii]